MHTHLGSDCYTLSGGEMNPVDVIKIEKLKISNTYLNDQEKQNKNYTKNRNFYAEQVFDQINLIFCCNSTVRTNLKLFAVTVE